MNMQFPINFNAKVLLFFVIHLTYLLVNCSDLNYSANDKNLIFDLKLNYFKQFTINMLIGSSQKEITLMISTLNNENILLSKSCSNCSFHRKFNKETSESLVIFNEKAFIEVIYYI